MPGMSDAIDRLTTIMDRLRDPGGCPWDREQTLATLAPYLLEEAHEVAEAIALDDPTKLCEELGDLLLQIVFMARIAREQSRFTLDDVADGISAKMIRRHPHVFADRKVADSEEVLRNWEDIKRDERVDQQAGASALDGVPAALPALLKAYRMTEKAAAVGFDWRRPADVMVKMREEMTELEAELNADDDDATDRVRAELGDVLFVMANLARHLGLEPETALQRSNASFKRRFESMEAQALVAGRSLRDMSLEEQDALWEEAKRLETPSSDDRHAR
jgi:MazG family protein